jgi:hypothetical protein
MGFFFLGTFRMFLNSNTPGVILSTFPDMKILALYGLNNGYRLRKQSQLKYCPVYSPNSPRYERIFSSLIGPNDQTALNPFDRPHKLL